MMVVATGPPTHHTSAPQAKTGSDFLKCVSQVWWVFFTALHFRGSLVRDSLEMLSEMPLTCLGHTALSAAVQHVPEVSVCCHRLQREPQVLAQDTQERKSKLNKCLWIKLLGRRLLQGIQFTFIHLRRTKLSHGHFNSAKNSTKKQNVAYLNPLEKSIQFNFLECLAQFAFDFSRVNQFYCGWLKPGMAIASLSRRKCSCGCVQTGNAKLLCWVPRMEDDPVQVP